MAVFPAARTVRPERPSSVPPGRRFWGGPAAVLQSANSAPPGLFVLPNRQPRRASTYLLDTTASLQLPTDGARMAMGFCWIGMGAHAAALARHRTKGARGERYGPPGRTLGALSPALFSVEKTKKQGPLPYIGKEPCICIYSVARRRGHFLGKGISLSRKDIPKSQPGPSDAGLYGPNLNPQQL